MSEATQTQRVFTLAAATGGDTKHASKLSKAIASATPSLGRRGQLRATLTWTGREDLDIAVVDRSGRRISTLHDRGKARAREASGSEELNLSKVRGAVFVEVSRHRHAVGEDVATGPVAASLELVTPHGKRTIPLSVPVGSTRAAKVFWTR